MDKFFTTEEAAVELGVTAARARQLIRAGVLKAHQFGKSYVITSAAIAEARLRHNKPGPVPKAKSTNNTKLSSKKKGGKK